MENEMKRPINREAKDVGERERGGNRFAAPKTSPGKNSGLTFMPIKFAKSRARKEPPRARA